MPQPIRGEHKNAKKKRKPRPKTRFDFIDRAIERQKKPHPEYGTSKLEDKFAKEFLDKLGVKYVRQYEAKEIKRFYDFYIEEENILIEVDGDYWHGFGLLYENMKPMQKRNNQVDKIKDSWAYEHGIPIIRIWEHDINDNPEKVMKLLKEQLNTAIDRNKKKENKNKRH